MDNINEFKQLKNYNKNPVTIASIYRNSRKNNKQ